MGLSIEERLDKYIDLKKNYDALVIKCRIARKNAKVEIINLTLKVNRCRKRTSDAPMNPSQNDLIKYELESLLRIGVTNKDLIFTTIEKNLKIQRPTVRRVAREMRMFYEESYKILSVDVAKNHKNTKKSLDDEL